MKVMQIWSERKVRALWKSFRLDPGKKRMHYKSHTDIILKKKRGHYKSHADSIRGKKREQYKSHADLVLEKGKSIMKVMLANKSEPCWLQNSPSLTDWFNWFKHFSILSRLLWISAPTEFRLFLIMIPTEFKAPINLVVDNWLIFEPFWEWWTVTLMEGGPFWISFVLFWCQKYDEENDIIVHRTLWQKIICKTILEDNETF